MNFHDKKIKKSSFYKNKEYLIQMTQMLMKN